MRKYIFLLAAFLALWPLLMSFYPTDKHAEAVKSTEAEAAAFAGAGLLSYSYTLDTLTNANNDTLALPYTLQSRYTQAFQITRTSISGTANIAVTVQMSTTTSSTTDAIWVTVLTSAATTATPEVLTLAESYGQRYRIIFDGTGTQSTSYKLSWCAKRQPN